MSSKTNNRLLVASDLPEDEKPQWLKEAEAMDAEVLEASRLAGIRSVDAVSTMYVYDLSIAIWGDYTNADVYCFRGDLIDAGAIRNGNLYYSDKLIPHLKKFLKEISKINTNES
jgi:hypothetical protein